MSNATQFKAVSTPSGKRAFEAHVAVWYDNDREIVIGAPTLPSLEKAWQEITGTELDSKQAQFVWIVSAT